MLIDGEQLLAQQLSVTDVTEVTFPDGRQTVLHPVRYMPVLDDPTARLSLDGAWRVARWPFAAEEALLASPQTGDAAWPVVAQPGKVFTQDVERCTADMPGWDRIGLTHLDPEDGALLRREVTIPLRWAGERIFLTFDSIYPAGRVYLNGTLLGEHASGLTPVEWEVTHLVTPGATALVAVRLLRRHPFVKMDMPRHAGEFAGLAQTAYFHAAAPCHLAAYRIDAVLDETRHTGSLTGSVTIANTSDRTATGTLTLALRAPDGALAGTGCEAHISVPAGETATPDLSATVDSPLLWNDEYPNLYTVEITLALPGQAVQRVSYRTGFRRFELTDERPLLNGAPVKFRGVNHLTYHPEHGLYTPEAWLRQNLQLMKRANVNCIRTHYLGPRCLAALCDELGIYLLQELPIDWGTNYIHDPAWVGPALQRIQGGILRDRHHPSVMLWCIGNENMPESLAVAEDGYNHLRIYERFAKTLDPSRPVMFPPPGPTNTVKGIFEVRVGDIADTHYSFKLVKEFQRTGQVTNPIAWTGEMETVTHAQARARGWSGVWFSSEYGIANLMPDLLHAPYGDIINDVPEDADSGRSTLEVFTDRLRREWGYMRGDPTCLGGAYFPWICGAAGDNPWGWTVWAEDNDWGIVTADLLPKPFFWAMRVLFSPVWFPERVAWSAGQESVRFTIANQFNAIDLHECTLRTMLAWGKSACTREWRDIPLACPPGESCVVEIPLWNADARATLAQGVVTVCRVVLLTPSGYRPLTADILLTPEVVKEDEKKELLIGPDAR